MALAKAADYEISLDTEVGSVQFRKSAGISSTPAMDGFLDELRQQFRELGREQLTEAENGKVTKLVKLVPR